MKVADAIQGVQALTSLSLEIMVAIQEYNVLIATAQKEGRDITDAELATLKVDSDVVTNQVLAALKTPGPIATGQ